MDGMILNMEFQGADMKFLTIGDIHGRDNWKVVRDHFDLEEYDKIIFIGDYTDSFDKEDTEILRNLEEIIEFKLAYPDKVVLLLGNHDITYLEHPNQNCPGFRYSMLHALYSLLRDNREHFQIAYQYENYLWTHAGMSKGWMRWCKKHGCSFEDMFQYHFYKSYADIFNDMNKTRERELLYSRATDPYTDRHPGILWIRPEGIEGSLPEGLHQIVGHTPRADIKTYKQYQGKNFATITYVDVLANITDFYELEV